MYWSRTGSVLDLLLWLLLTLLTGAGGWLVCVHVFRLRPLERPYAGLSAGLLWFILFGNLLAQFLPLTLAYWLTALLILGLGLLAAGRSTQRPRFPWTDWLVWRQPDGLPLALVFGLLLAVFLNINRGLALFDDYSNLPLVSIIASGDVPPHFYLDPTHVLDYHYGLHLLAASLARIGGFYPWSALDFYKALSIVLALMLGLLWYRRHTGRGWALLAVGLFVLFAGGARGLLLLLPEDTLRGLGQNVQMVGSAMQTAPDLYSALLGPWRIEGDGPVPFPFALISGVARPLSLAMGSNSAMPLVTLFLLLLLGRRRWTPIPGLAYGLLLTALALISDHLFALAWGGLALAICLRAGLRRDWRAGLDWLWALLPGLILAPVMGGVLSQTFQRLLGGGSAQQSSIGLPGIALRWPPAIYSAHLGALSLLDPGQALLAVIEIGPLLLLSVWTTLAAWRYLRSGRLFMAGLGLMGVISFLTPLFLRFVERERDITRLSGAALTIWMILGLPYVFLAFRRGKPLARWLIAAGYLAAIFGGLALFPIQMIASMQTQPSFFIQSPDAQMARRYWNALEPAAWVMDPSFAFRPSVVLGRTTGPAYQNVYISLPEYDALVAGMDAKQIAQAGYSYVYLDRTAWQGLTPLQRDAFQRNCVQLLAEEKDKFGDYRRLYDLKNCR